MLLLKKYRIDVETTLLYCGSKKQINNDNNRRKLERRLRNNPRNPKEGRNMQKQYI
jgi:hypothetical protein